MLFGFPKSLSRSTFVETKNSPGWDGTADSQLDRGWLCSDFNGNHPQIYHPLVIVWWYNLSKYGWFILVYCSTLPSFSTEPRMDFWSDESVDFDPTLPCGFCYIDRGVSKSTTTGTAEPGVLVWEVVMQPAMIIHLLELNKIVLTQLPGPALMVIPIKTGPWALWGSIACFETRIIHKVEVLKYFDGHI